MNMGLLQKISERFDEISHTEIVSSYVDENNPQLQELLDYFGNVNGKKILDVGCGKGKFARSLIARGAKVTGIDLSPKLIKYTKDIKGGEFLIGTATDLAFVNEEFDYVYSVEVIEHIPDYKKAIKEMVRVLKKDGKICIIDKNIVGLTYRFLFPYILLKKYKEFTGKWMYPKEFPFREIWFFPWEIKSLLKKYCKEVSIKYLPLVKKDKLKIFFKLFPAFNIIVSWRGVK